MWFPPPLEILTKQLRDIQKERADFRHLGWQEKTIKECDVLIKQYEKAIELCYNLR